jgi:hypothetical protein
MYQNILNLNLYISSEEIDLDYVEYLANHFVHEDGVVNDPKNDETEPIPYWEYHITSKEIKFLVIFGCPFF